MEYKKNVLGVKEARNMEDLKAENEILKANLDYLAMMTDVELDEEEEEGETE